VRSDSKGKI